MTIMKEYIGGLTFVFDSWLSGLWDMLNDPPISLWEWTEWGWEIKESCVLTEVFCDVGLSLSFLFQLLQRCTPLYYNT